LSFGELHGGHTPCWQAQLHLSSWDKAVPNLVHPTSHSEMQTTKNHPDSPPTATPFLHVFQWLILQLLLHLHSFVIIANVGNSQIGFKCQKICSLQLQDLMSVGTTIIKRKIKVSSEN
jgi:hypothetical protein